ncbi:MAG: aldo/keto reductase [Candidatus Eisenbacteria bacterium]|uniref:Aldo/keto reductase n=1 Tax=Eiseniibacteriota bacterium TaxID=2212470 RepID=A0A7Y2EDU0_UNCEI|nr:aldo/keto reductase [Candidatus Eisenbacteria bacterium]
MIKGHATLEGTSRLKQRTPAADDFFANTPLGWISSLGLGTYLGNFDKASDQSFEASIQAAVGSGINLLDTAINYRFQRSEKCIAAALKKSFTQGVSRDEIVVCTKGGFVPFQGAPPSSPDEARLYIESRFIDRGIVKESDFHQMSHSLHPKYIADQFEASRRNLNLETIDIYYLHNPETQLPVLGPDDFEKQVKSNFEFLERKISDGHLQSYGFATWEGFRHQDDSFGWLNLPEILGWAKDVAGDNHHFQFIQLPFSLALTEGYRVRNQPPDDKPGTILEVAQDLGIHVVASASLHQGKLIGSLPEFIHEAFPDLDNDVLRSIQFTRSTPGVTSALVGMGNAAHVTENLAIREHPQANPSVIVELLS